MQKGQGKLEDRIKARYNGENDPLAQKIVEKTKSVKVPCPPEDYAITTLFLGGISEETSEDTIREHLESFGRIASIRIMKQKQCAFVCFMARPDAEFALKTLFNRLYIHSKKIKILWAKAQLDIDGVKKKREHKIK